MVSHILDSVGSAASPASREECLVFEIADGIGITPVCAPRPLTIRLAHRGELVAGRFSMGSPHEPASNHPIKKPTWRNARERFTTSAYLLAGLPVRLDCPFVSRPTATDQKLICPIRALVHT